MSNLAEMLNSEFALDRLKERGRVPKVQGNVADLMD
jgi:hypothetical protein